MKRITCALALLLYLIGHAWAEDPVNFPDAKLKAAVEETLWISDPTPTDMLNLTELSHLQEWGDEGNGIAELTGLEYATNLQSLNLRMNCVSDLSALSGLTNLESLNISQNHLISDVSPLSGLVNLRYLNLHENVISNVSPLSGLANLETLILRYCEISDISPLAGLFNLHELDLRMNHISDISPLCALTSLSNLNIRDNPLPDEAYEVLIPQIVANNPGISISHEDHADQWLSLSSTVGGSVIDPAQGDSLYAYDTLVRIEAKADPGFVFAGWSGTYFAAQNPALVAMNEAHRIQANFQSSSSVLYVDNDARTDPRPGDASVSDPQEDGTAEHPFDSIQKAIEVAAEGASILVDAGTYRENIDFQYKNVRLIGRDPNDPNRASWPVLEGVNADAIVCFDSDEGPECLLMGFVITQGSSPSAEAILCDGASPTIAHCLIVGNRASESTGAVIYCQDSQAVLTNCTIADNYAGPEGAVLMLIDSDVTVLDSIFWNDRMTNEILAIGTSDPNIQYCGVRRWWPDWGNIHKDPLFACPGVWVDPDDPDHTSGPENPKAILVGGDYHLRSQTGRWDPDAKTWVQDKATSPCIDAGLRTSSVAHEPAPNGGRINMGAYGGTIQASKSPINP